MNHDDTRQPHDGNDVGADGAAPASLYAPESIDDVPTSVRAAVVAFVPPPGFVDFPKPTKNSLQRSIIYYFGRRVQSTVTGKSKWFCLASPQCRANKTTISTTANISGCTRHLQVFHQLVSPKTVMISRKSSSSAPGSASPERQSLQTDKASSPQRSFLSSSQPQQQQLKPAPVALIADTSSRSSATEQLLSPPAAAPAASPNACSSAPLLAPEPQVSPRERALAWTRTAVVRHLLPLAVASDGHLLERSSPSPATSSSTELSEKAVRHHLIELYAAAQHRITASLASELALAALPTLHLALVAVPSRQDCRAHGLDVASERFAALHVRFVSSRFVREQHVIAVTRHADPFTRTRVPTLTRWLTRVLERVGIATKHVRSFVVDPALGDAVALYEDAATALLGRACERSVAAALPMTPVGDDASCLEQLVDAVCAYVRAASAADFAACLDGLERHVLALLAVEAPHVPWPALMAVLERVAQSWDACKTFFRENDRSAMPALLETFTRDDLAQCVALVRPIADFVNDVRAPASECAEAVIRMYAVQQTGLNAAQALAVAIYGAKDAASISDTDSEDNNRGKRRDSNGDDSDSEREEDEDALLEHSELTAFAQRLREELARRWSARVAEHSSAPSLTALTCVFFHPCFRQLSFLDAAAKTRLHAHVLALARDVLDWRFATTAPRDDTSTTDAAPVKKRRLSRHEKLTRQAQELSRLGFLDSGAASHGTTPERSARTADRAAADVAVARELERYVQNEAVAFCDVPFDQTLPYWQHKAFDYPTLALVAQAALGHPAALPARLGDLDDPKSPLCIRCVFGGQSSRPWPAAMRSETKAMEELTLVLHCSDLSTLTTVRELSDWSTAQVVAALVREREDASRP